MMRGIRTDQELDPSLLLRDTRTLGQRLGEFFRDPTGVSIVIFSCALIQFIYPAASLVIFIIMLLLFMYTFTHKRVLPFRLPQTSEAKDHNDLIPGIKKPRTARGITFSEMILKQGKNFGLPMMT